MVLDLVSDICLRRNCRRLELHDGVKHQATDFDGWKGCIYENSSNQAGCYFKSVDMRNASLIPAVIGIEEQ